jgi:hypothetical protein
MGGQRSPEEIARMMLLTFGPAGLADLLRAFMREDEDL